jgi:hypothetical protein
MILSDDFESGDLSAWSYAVTDEGDLSVSETAAIGGAYGLQAVVDDNRSIYLVDGTPEGEAAYAARFYFDSSSISMASGNAHTVMLGQDAAGLAVFRVDLRSFQGDFQLRGVAILDQTPSYVTPWWTITNGPHFIEALWRASSSEDAGDGSFALLVDDATVEGNDFLDIDTRLVDSVRFGAVSGVDAGTRGTYHFDSFSSTRGHPIGADPSISLPPPPPAPNLIFADGFEGGDSSAWSTVKGNGDLQVTSAAAMAGAWGMEAIVNDTATLYVTDWSPFQDPTYNARLALDPNNLTMLDGRSHAILQGLMGSSQVILRVEMQYRLGSYEIRAGTIDLDGIWRNTAWHAITNEAHTVEVNWRATNMWPPDGSLSLAVDGSILETLGGISNSGRQIDLVRLGAVAGLDAGTLGSMYFDEFESWRTAAP